MVIIKNWRGNEDLALCISSTPQLIDSLEFIHTPRYRDKDFLQQKYLTEGRSIAQIAREIGSSKQAVRENLKRFDVPLRLPRYHHGNPSQPRFGAKKVKGTLTEHIAEQRAIDAIRQMRAEGMGLRQIARTLTQLQIPTKCRGKSWHPEMVRRILEG